MERAEGRAAFDQVAGELRAALDWAAAAPDQRAGGYRLAIRLAELCFARGLPGEAQRRYEQAAALAADQHAAATALRDAAAAAEIRHFGGDAMRLHRASAAAALRAGDRPRAAYHLAQAAELVSRGPGLMPEPVPPGTAARLIAEAAALAGGDPAAQARVVIAAGFDGARLDAVSAELAERGITLARRAGDPLGESAALDLQTSIQVAYGDIAGRGGQRAAPDGAAGPVAAAGARLRARAVRRVPDGRRDGDRGRRPGRGAKARRGGP